MQDGKVSANDSIWLANALDEIGRRKDSFGRVLATCAVYNNGSAWRNVLSRFVLLDKNSRENYDKSLEYPDMKVVQSTFELPEIETLLKELVEKGRLILPDKTAVTLEGSFQNYAWGFPSLPNGICPSENPFGLGWPAKVFCLQPANSYQQSASGQPMVGLDLPMYESGNALVSDVFQLGQRSNLSFIGEVYVAVPCYDARIGRVKPGPKVTELEVETRDVSYEGLVVKARCESAGKSEQFQIPLTGAAAQIQTQFPPDSYSIYLLSKTGQAIDCKRFGMGWVNLPPGVIIERTPENIEDIIRRGESREVEFKASLPKNWDDFAETIVAMSNGGGGVVFVGVDDNGVIMGCEDPKIADSINDNLRSVCDPPIEPEISREPLQGKTVVIVRIAEGKRKPYVLKGKGVYVRIGATDRIATRDETLSLTGPDTSQFGRAPWNS